MNTNLRALVRCILPALGAVNIAVPVITTAVAVTAMFPMGGSTVVAIRMGRGDKDGANRAFMTAFSLAVVSAAVLMLVGTCLSVFVRNDGSPRLLRRFVIT